ncbi:contact-dependent growth inhibition system immunity protein [Streptomyces sp. 900116325]
MTRPLNLDRSLEELEDDRWPAPSGDATRFVATAHALRRKPIGELTVEDMRLLIGQNEGLPHLLPPALEVLRLDPMAEGHMYESDLLAAVLTRSPETWSKSPGLGRELRLVVSDLSDLTPDLKREVERFLALQHAGGTALQVPRAQVGHCLRGLSYERSRARAASRDVRG